MKAPMRVPFRRVLAAGALLTLAAGALSLPRVPAARAAEPALASVRAIAAPLSRGRRAQAEIHYDLADPFGGPARPIRGRVSIESPDRVRIDFETTGERITLRRDGGEWLQPAAQQMIRIPADRAANALMWWLALLPTSRDVFREDSLGARRFRLTPRDKDAGPFTVLVALDSRGLPSRLTIEGGEETLPASYRFTGWRFAAARGAAAYKLTAPAGYSTIDLP